VQPTGTSFHYLHLMLPHQPWMHYPDGSVYDAAEEFTDAELPFVMEADWGFVTLEQAHLLQAQYTDRLLGEIFDTLRSTGRYDESLVVVTADHGISFRTWPHIRDPDLEAPESISAIAYVPLIIKEPGQTEGRVDDANLMGQDLLPTIVDILGIDLPGDIDGLAASDPQIADRADRKQIHDFGTGFTPEFQGILEFDGSARPTTDMRWIGAIDSDEHPLGGVLSHIGVEEHLGADPAALPTMEGGRARVAALDEVASPSGDTALGYLHGHIDDEPDEGTLLVALGGEVASAAPVDVNGAFRAPLPPPPDDGFRGDLELLLLVDDEFRRLDVDDLG
jgi:hypothetical protein